MFDFMAWCSNLGHDVRTWGMVSKLRELCTNLGHGVRTYGMVPKLRAWCPNLRHSALSAYSSGNNKILRPELRGIHSIQILGFHSSGGGGNDIHATSPPIILYHYLILFSIVCSLSLQIVLVPWSSLCFSNIITQREYFSTKVLQTLNGTISDAPFKPILLFVNNSFN